MSSNTLHELELLSKKQEAQPMETQAHTTLTIPGKQCQHCAQTVTSTLTKPLGSADAKAPFILSDGKCPTK